MYIFFFYVFFAAVLKARTRFRWLCTCARCCIQYNEDNMAAMLREKTKSYFHKNLGNLRFNYSDDILGELQILFSKDGQHVDVRFAVES